MNALAPGQVHLIEPKTDCIANNTIILWSKNSKLPKNGRYTTTKDNYIMSMFFLQCPLFSTPQQVVEGAVF